MLGESKRGLQNQSIVPSVATSADVCRSPIRPCSAIPRYSFVMEISSVAVEPGDADLNADASAVTRVHPCADRAHRSPVHPGDS